MPADAAVVATGALLPRARVVPSLALLACSFAVRVRPAAAISFGCEDVPLSQWRRWDLRPERRWHRRLVPGNGPLTKVSPIVAFVFVAAVFAAGVLVSGLIGAGLLAVLACLVAALLVVTWRRLPPAERALRLVTLLVLIAVAVSVAR